MEAKVYNQKGEVAGSVKLPEKVFGAPWRADLVHQVVEGMRANKRAATAYAKDRSEVSGTGKKPWRQKGTGRARHGSRRSPIWVGGGVAHGPTKEKSYKKTLSKKMRREALYSVLSKKLADGEILFVDSLTPNQIKTKEAGKVLENLSSTTGIKELVGKKRKVLATLVESNENTQKSFRNLPQVETAFVKDLNPMVLLDRKYVLIENAPKSVKILESKMEKKEVKKVSKKEEKQDDE